MSDDTPSSTQTVDRSFRDRLAAMLESDLRRRGPSGETLLRVLRGENDDSSAGWERTLRRTLAAVDAAPSHERTVSARVPAIDDARRLIVVGDLHGRWDCVRPILHELGVLDSAGHWSADEGTVLVQMGDILDCESHVLEAGSAETSEAFRAHANAVERALDAVSDASRRDRLRAIATGAAGDDVARRDLLGAVLVHRTVSALRQLELQATERGGRVVVLMGNHELDLLSGRFWWLPGQKRMWLALAGLTDLESTSGPIEDARGALDLVRRHASSQPVLEWLLKRPLLTRVHNVLLVHGGPERTLTHVLTREDASEFADVQRALGDAWERDALAGDAFAEGRSIFSPSRARDDFVGDVALLRPWLVASRCDWLAVGHSPFLSFPAHEWPDPDQEAVSRHLSRIDRVGIWNNILKTDTNLKRGDRAEVLVADFERDTLEAVSTSGRRTLLEAGETLREPRVGYRVVAVAESLLEDLDRRRGAALHDLAEAGLDARDFDTIFSYLERADEALESSIASSLRESVMLAVRAVPTETRQLFTELARAAHGTASSAEALIEHGNAIRDRAEEIAGRVPLDSAPLRLLVDGDAARVDGVRYRILELVVESLRTRESVARTWRAPILAGELVRGKSGEPGLRLSEYPPGAMMAETERFVSAPADATTSWASLEAWAHRTLKKARLTEATQEAETGSMRTASPHGRPRTDAPGSEGSTPGNLASFSRPTLPADAVESLLVKTVDALAAHVDASNEALRDELTRWARASFPEAVTCLEAGWCDVPGPWPRLRLVLTPRRELLFADTTFIEPSAELCTLHLSEAGHITTVHSDHGQVLSEAVGLDQTVVIHSNVREPVYRRLVAGEVQSLLDGQTVSEAAWCQGCYLFGAFEPDVARHFACTNPIDLEFRVPSATFHTWLERGWVRLNLMVSDTGAPIVESKRWGSRAVAVEVVAVGAEGVAALWQHRRRG